MNSFQSQQIVDYLKSHHASKIGVFGSFARGDYNDTSDVDILVTFKTNIGLLELVKFERELSLILGRKVDLVTNRSLVNKKIEAYVQRDLKMLLE
ncbi:MAG: nucleotidyltransferase family protein [Crocinitomicaceae bacterium]|nr:nucleotidyltransferase family protein [Crocinitomicaceae bacterium]MBK8924509.1 nucleotidyltransferase family protein [Crocinitomicaceae bacterium]